MELNVVNHTTDSSEQSKIL